MEKTRKYEEELREVREGEREREREREQEMEGRKGRDVLFVCYTYF